jgi:hypothetical protein
LTISTSPAPRRRSPNPKVVAHPVAAFFGFTYLYSWLFWAPAAFGYGGTLGDVAVFIGVWGPAAAGLTVTWLLGRSIRDWIRRMLNWRVAKRWYAFALLVPAAVVAVVSVAFVALSEDLDGSLLGERVALYIPMLVFVTLLGGGNGSFNAANGTLVLRDEIEGNAYATMQYCITLTTLIVIAALLWTTRGRLGPDTDLHTSVEPQPRIGPGVPEDERRRTNA